MDNSKLVKALKQAQERVSAIEAKAADIAAQLDAARAALEHAEAEHQAQLAASVLDGNADTVRARKALESAREHVDKLTAAAARLARERDAARAEVAEAEKAVLAAQIADLDAEGMALFTEAVKSLSALWRAGQSAVDAGHLRPYDRARAQELPTGKAALWRTLLALSREVAYMLTNLEHADAEAFAKAGGVTERERDYWLQGVQTLAL